MIGNNYEGKAVFSGDWWAATRDEDGSKDWVMIGDDSLMPGSSLREIKKL